MNIEDIQRYLKGIVARMETDSGYVAKLYTKEDIKRDWFQLLTNIK